MTATRLRALVVDDEPPMQRLIARELVNLGFDCDLASDGLEARQKVARSQYEVVITDLRMPNRHGHSLALELLAQPQRPLIVVYTGVIEPKLAADLLTRGVDDIVFKPIDMPVLAAKVKAMVRRRAAGSADSGAGAAAPGGPPPAAADDSPQLPLSLTRLNEKLSELMRVLPLTSVAIDVYEMTNGYEWEVSQIAAAIQRDAALAADILRVANSALYNHTGRQIVRLEEAILRIGQKRVGELALTANALSLLTPSLLPWIDVQLEWKRSMAAGIALEALIEAGGHQQLEHGLLLSAIMHPLGRIVLGMLAPRQYEFMIERCRQTGESLREQERQMIPAGHTQVMASLLSAWRVPTDVTLPLRFSLDDFSSLARLAEPIRTKAELVKLAVILGRLAVGRWQPYDLVELPPPRVLTRLRVGCAGSIVRQTAADVERLAGFRSADEPQDPSPAAPRDETEIAYLHLAAEADDLVAPFLPSLGLRPVACPPERLADLDRPAVVNALGASPARIASLVDGPRAQILIDEELRPHVGRLAKLVALPDSFARLESALRWQAAPTLPK